MCGHSDARGRADCAVFDFTNLYSARHSCAVRVRKGKRLLVALVGDSLIQPFWPEGTGCGRGVLSALDAAWMVRQSALFRINPLEILAERENVYKLLSRTTDRGGGDLKENHKSFALDPSTRYRNISKVDANDRQKVLGLYDTDEEEVDSFVRSRFYEAKGQRPRGTLLQRLRKAVVKTQLIRRLRPNRGRRAAESAPAQAD